MLELTAPEMTVLVGGLRGLNANIGQSQHGVFTDQRRDADQRLLRQPARPGHGVVFAFEHLGFWKSMDTYKESLDLTELWRGLAAMALRAGRRSLAAAAALLLAAVACGEPRSEVALERIPADDTTTSTVVGGDSTTIASVASPTAPPSTAVAPRRGATGPGTTDPGSAPGNPFAVAGQNPTSYRALSSP